MANGEAMGAMTSTARPVEDGYVLNGQKVFITGGGYAKVFVVFARTTDEGPSHKQISAFIVDRDTPGFTVGEGERKMGIRGSSTTPLIFQDVHLPRSALLGASGSPPRRWASLRVPWRHRWATPRNGFSSANPSPGSRPSSGCWPTWQPTSRLGGC